MASAYLYTRPAVPNGAITSILTLADELKQGTIETLLTKDDAELGWAWVERGERMTERTKLTEAEIIEPTVPPLSR